MLNLRKKLLVSIFTLMLALVAVSTTTYAWFTLGNVTEVSNLEMSVEGAAGLEIRVESINGVKTKDVESLAKLNNWATTHDLSGLLTGDYAVKLRPLYMNDLTDGSLVPITGILSEIPEGAESNAEYGEALLNTSKNYIEITFEFKTLSSTKQSVIFEDLQATAVKSHSFETSVELKEVGSLVDEVSDVNGVKVIKANTNMTNVRAANALRVAYYSAADSKYVVADPSEYDWKPGNQCGQWAGTALEYFNAIDQSKDSEGNDLVLKAPSPYAYTTVESSETKIVDLEWNSEEEASFGSITIRIWLEGWDADCFNAVAFDDLKFAIKFSSVATN